MPVSSRTVALFYLTFLGALGCFWPFFGLHLREAGLAPSQATAVMALWPLGGLLAPPLLGLVADARAARGWLLRGVTLLGLLSFGGFLAHIPAVLVATTMLVAVARSSVLPMLDALAME